MQLIGLTLVFATFLDAQLQFPRVRAAKAHSDRALATVFAEHKLVYPPREIFIRVFKREKTLEVWAKKGDAFSLAKSYRICASSGGLGPKVQSGDGQVPEGVYTLSVFNPTSAYHLSLKVDYPNAADRARSSAIFGHTASGAELGGDIFIHGDCVTIGCLPLTDEKIEEVYWLAVLAKTAGQASIPVHVFPARLDDSTLVGLLTLEKEEHVRTLWRDLARVFASFERDHRVPFVRINGERYEVH
jgi:murein L,D-transpeptidase YafK